LNLIRAFLAIEIPAEIQQKLKTLVMPLSRQPGQAVRWVKAENVHLTLKFFGDTEKARLEKLNGCLQRGLAGHLPFQLQVGGFGAFPNFNRPRVFWCGLSQAPELNALLEVVENVTAANGFPAENRPFSPHLTLGRAGDHAAPQDLQQIAAAFRQFPADSLGVVPVTGLIIFSSQLSRGGSIYTPLYHIPLSAPESEAIG
jgi:RNA 2',3'-cyclic 3'-phosphodiesterase